MRRVDDFYETPKWCVDRFIEVGAIPDKGKWLEPAAGHGAIIKAVNRHYQLEWDAVELRDSSAPFLLKLSNVNKVVFSDFFESEVLNESYDVVITNPPYSLALTYIQKSLQLASYVVMLLRLNFLAGAKRAGFFTNNMPDVYVLPNRPSFTGDGRTDATEYAWFVWRPVRRKQNGTVTILAETPKGVR